MQLALEPPNFYHSQGLIIINHSSGGLGITGGMADIDAVYCCLLGIYEGKADEAILDKYSEIRRQKFINFVNPASSRNITLLFSTNPDTALEDSEFLKQCVKAEKDPEFLAQFSLVRCLHIANFGRRLLSFIW